MTACNGAVKNAAISPAKITMRNFRIMILKAWLHVNNTVIQQWPTRRTNNHLISPPVNPSRLQSRKYLGQTAHNRPRKRTPDERIRQDISQQGVTPVTLIKCDRIGCSEHAGPHEFVEP